jgi:transcription antitermination factor NusG
MTAMEGAVPPGQDVEPCLAWYVIRSATRREATAERELRAAGFPVYLPCLTRWRRHAGVKEKIRRPLFPGYIFVGIDHARQSFAQIRGVDGVHALVSKPGLDGAPAEIPLHWVSQVLVAEIFGAFDETIPSRVRFRGLKGERVQIAGGQFVGFLAALLEDTGDKKKVRVELQGLGGGKMKVAVDHLRAA